MMGTDHASRIVAITPDMPWARTEACRAWCEAHGIASQDCYRIEIDPEAVGHAVTVFEYARNAEGRYSRSEANPMELATRPPYTVPLRFLPDVLDVLRADSVDAALRRQYLRDDRDFRRMLNGGRPVNQGSRNGE